MRFTRFFILLLICYFAGSNAVIAQGDKKITINVTDVSLLKFVEEIERSTNYRFYFDPVETDSLLITVKADNATLDQVMQTALQQSVFQYAVDQLNRVYITKKYKIQTEIPADFFDGKKAAKDTASEPVILLPGADEKDKLRASLEKKLFEIGQRTSSISKGNARLTGYVRDVKSGEAISGASVYVDTPSIKTITDQFGYFAITLPKGRHTLRVNSLGMKDTRRQLICIPMENSLLNWKIMLRA
jgi:type II secretory pathway component GspD/PulD (secretin)